MRQLTAVVVEDDLATAELLATILRDLGLAVETAGSGADALALVADAPPDLVTLDLTLPDVDGLTVARRVRASSNCYLMIISARDTEGDSLAGFAAGADDYVAKPFTPALLRARVNAMLQRPRPRRDDTALHCGAGLVVEPQRREVTLAGSPVPLTPTEYALLAHLASNLSQVCSRAELVREIWGSRLARDAHLIDVHVANLRAKLRQRAEHEWIQTVRGVGYRLDPVHTAQPDT